MSWWKIKLSLEPSLHHDFIDVIFLHNLSRLFKNISNIIYDIDKTDEWTDDGVYPSVYSGTKTTIRVRGK